MHCSIPVQSDFLTRQALLREVMQKIFRKKLNFMGNELAMFREWSEKRETDWELMKIPHHDLFHRYILELNRIYLKQEAIWQLDHTYAGFKWVDCKSDNKCVFAYMRIGEKSNVFAVFNFSDQEAAIIPQVDGDVTMVLNTDWELFGGRTVKSVERALVNSIPPFTGLLYSCQ